MSSSPRDDAPDQARIANQRADAQRNRASILVAAPRVLRRNPAASVAEIAAEAGLGRMTVYGHFKTRAELIDAAVTESLGRGEDILAQVPLDGPPAEAFGRLIESSWTLLNEARGLLAAAQEELPSERVRELHRAFGIYDECDCDAPDPATHLDVDDVGLTCNLMYRVCAECCRDDVYQTEGCASYHAHRLDEDYHCPTIRALDEENAQSRAPQHPNTYRQPEGNRA